MRFDKVRDIDGVEVLVNLDTVKLIKPSKMIDARGNSIAGSMLVFTTGGELWVTRTVDRFWSDWNSL